MTTGRRCVGLRRATEAIDVDHSIMHLLAGAAFDDSWSLPDLIRSA
jgi:hypothetical protein